jgi:hypothetical protein
MLPVDLREFAAQRLSSFTQTSQAYASVPVTATGATTAALSRKFHQSPAASLSLVGAGAGTLEAADGDR